MACNLLARLFRRRTSRLPVSANATGVPALPVSSDNLPQLEDSLKQLDLDHQTNDNLFHLGSLIEQGSCILSIPEVPLGLSNACIESLRLLPGFVGLETCDTDDSGITVDIFVHFSTACEAALAMASNPTINLENGSTRRLQHDHRDHETIERAAKRQKIEPVVPPPRCLVCCEELPGPHVRPCLFCDKRWCYECMKTNFTVALNDPERFPSQCCGRVVHHDVARGILSPEDHDKYRKRFEEHSTTKPIYCASPTCSAFLPSRLAKPDKRGRVTCFSCDTVTCSECREAVPPTDAKTHVCIAADQVTALIKQFDYKRCPRCNTGVARMFGCSHIRCQCGAHWCWDCERAIHICWSKPCDRAREDGDMTDDNDILPEESDSDDEATLEGSNNDLNQPVMPVQDRNVGSVDMENLWPADPGIAGGEEEEIQHAATTLQHDRIQQSMIDGESLQVENPRGLSQEGDWSLSDQIQALQDFVDTAGQEVTVGETSIAAQNPEDDNHADHVFPDSPIDVHVPTLGLAEGQVASGLLSLEHDPTQADVDASTEYGLPAVSTTTPAITPSLPATQGTSEAAETFVNLDPYGHEQWQTGDWDFGDEPLDETWDTWGCLHHFTPLHQTKMHEYWLPTRKNDDGLQSAKQVDCLKCYKTIEISEPDLEGDKADAARKDSGVVISPGNPHCVGEMPKTSDTTSAATEPGQLWKMKRNNKKDGPKLFNCTQCGVVYCTKCKKATVRELRASLEGNKSAD